MKSDLKEALDHITENIELYRNADIKDGHQLAMILQQVSATLFFLETERAKYHEQWQNIVSKFVLSGKTVARSENEAHVSIPEMYMLRRVMDSAYTVVEAIRSNISWIKHEQNLSNQ